MKKQAQGKYLRQFIKMFSQSIIFVCVFSFFILSVCAQDDIAVQDNKPKDLVPPPLSIISKEEKSLLDTQKDARKRTETAFRLMDARLIKASELSLKNLHKESLDELGGFQALLRNAFNFLKTGDSRKGKSIKNFKNFEITLRKFIPRLELVRREMPERYGYHVRMMIKLVREMRADSIEPLFGETVLRDPDN